MNLYLFVYELNDIDGECDWFFRVLDVPYVSTSDEEKYIAENMIGMDQAETKAEAIGMLKNFWSNKVTEQDGYKIKLIKKAGVTRKEQVYQDLFDIVSSNYTQDDNDDATFTMNDDDRDNLMRELVEYVIVRSI